jgi:ribosomal protein S5
MKRLITIVALAGFLSLPAMAIGETFNNVAVVDVNCSRKAAANPDAHTRDCALKCASSGFGIITGDQKFLKFDTAGNSKIVDELKASNKADHLRANVTGEVHGDTLNVKSIKLN